MEADIKDWSEYQRLNHVKRYRADFKRMPARLIEVDNKEQDTQTPDDQE